MQILYVVLFLCFGVTNLIESFPIQDSYILYDVRTNGPLDEARYKNAYQRLFYEQVTDEQLQHEGIGKRWVPPTLYSLLCIYKIGLKFEEQILRANGRFMLAIPLEYIFTDKVYKKSLEPVLFNKEEKKQAEAPSVSGNLFSRLPAFLTKWVDAKKIEGMSQSFGQLWSRVTKRRKADQMIVKEPTHNRQLTPDLLLQLKKECNDFIVDCIVKQHASNDHLIDICLPELRIDFNRANRSYPYPKIKECTTTNPAMKDFGLDLLSIVKKAVFHEEACKKEDCLWAYRSGQNAYDKPDRSDMLFDERAYAFSLFSGYYSDREICPFLLFGSSWFNVPLTMVKIPKAEMVKQQSLWYIPKVTLFESLVSHGESIHMCTKVIYESEESYKKKRINLVSFTVPSIIPSRVYSMHDIKHDLDTIARDSIVLRPGRRALQAMSDALEKDKKEALLKEFLKKQGLKSKL